MAGKTARKHHYIPQCYLRGFTNGGGKKSKLRVLDAKTRSSFETGTHNVGARRDFLKVDIEGLPPDAHESEMSAFEGDLARTLRAVGEKRSINAEELEIILNFLGLLAIRNPAFRENFTGFMDDVLSKMMRLSLATKERWEGQVAQMKEKGVDLPDIPYEEMKRFVEDKQYELTLKTDFHIHYEFVGLDAILPHLFNRTWLLVEATDESGPFITSDHPVSLRWKHPEKIPPFYRNSPGFGMRDTQILFPLSKNLALIGEYEDVEWEGDIVSATAPSGLVESINSMLIGTSREQIYAPSFNFKFAGRDGTASGNMLLAYLK
jgi:hypothetical protein